MRWLAVINPRSGHRKDEGHIAALRDLLARRLGADVETVVTEHIGHALVLARRRDVDGFIAVGGDGTVFDVVNGMDLDSQVLGLLPAGTGNGLARELGLVDVEEALGRIVEGRQRRLDLITAYVQLRGGEICRYRITSTASLGYATDVVELANAVMKPLGPLCYPVTAVVQAFLSRPFTGRWRHDGGPWTVLDVTNLIVNNTRYAGDFEVFPAASATDGAADLVMARVGALRQMAHNLSVLTKLHCYHSGSEWRVQRVDIELDEERMVQLDGEIVPGVVAVTFELEPGRLRFAA